MIRWRLILKDDTEVIGDWGQSKYEGQTRQYLGNVKFAFIDCRRSGVLRPLVKVSGEDFVRLSWVCTAYQYHGVEYNSALCLESKTKDYIVTKGGDLIVKEKI